MKRFLKVLKITLISLFFILVLALFVAPRWARSYIEKNSQELIGRKVDVGLIRINYFKMALKISDFILYEENGIDAFVSFKTFYVNVQLWPALRGEYEVAEFLLDSPQISVVNLGEHFNFDSLSSNAAADTTQEEQAAPEDSVSAPLKIKLRNFKISGGSFTYTDIPQDYSHTISNLGLALDEFSWDNENAEADIALNFEPQGELLITADVNPVEQRYKLVLVLKELALEQFSPHLKAYLASSGIEGLYSNHIDINGSLKNTNDIVLSGNIELKDFVLNDADTNAVFKQALLRVELDSIDLGNQYFGVGDVLISGTEVYADLYDDYTNFDLLLQPMAKDTLQDTLAQEAEEPEDSTSSEDASFYRLNHLAFEKGSVFFTDHTLNRPFKYEVSDVALEVSNVSPLAQEVPVSYALVLNKAGKLKGDAQLNMMAPANLSYSAELRDLNLNSFSPYTEYYIARPVKRGHFEFVGDAAMSEHQFKAQNSLRINDIEMGSKTDDDPELKLPINLALAILKDKNGDVIIDLPMTGDPSDPDFNVGKIIVKTLTNFVVKVASAPFAVVGDINGVDPERLKEIPLAFGQSVLQEKERETLRQIALALEAKPELRFHFTLEEPIALEKQWLAMQRVKQDYLKSIGIAEEDMFDEMEHLDVRDDSLMAYTFAISGADSLSSFEEQCLSVVGEEQLAQVQQTLSTQRKLALNTYLLDSLQVDSSSVVVRQADLVNAQLELTQPRFNVEVSIK